MGFINHLITGGPHIVSTSDLHGICGLPFDQRPVLFRGILEEMKAANRSPDVISYNSALGAIDRAKGGKEERDTWPFVKNERWDRTGRGLIQDDTGVI